MKDYHVNIFYSDEDEGDIADISYCSAFGETSIEALQKLNLAKQAWIEAAKTNPSYCPPIAPSPIAPSLKGIGNRKTNRGVGVCHG